MSNVSALENPKAPHNQPFNIFGTKNKTKVTSWWNSTSPTYWRNKRREKVQANASANVAEQEVAVAA